MTRASAAPAFVKVEALESRRLLAGTASISGVVFDDRDADGTHEAGEGGLKNVRVYLDHDNDRVWDKSEPSAVTDKRGNFSFSKLGAGTYRLRQLTPSDRVQTAPRSGFFRVNLRDGQNLTRRMFADAPVRSDTTNGGVTGTSAINPPSMNSSVGIVDADDYASAGGEFDLNGSVDFDDSVLIDLAFNTRDAVLRDGRINSTRQLVTPEQIKAAEKQAWKDYKWAAKKGSVDEALRWLNNRDRAAKSATYVREIALHYSEHGAAYKRAFVRFAKDA
jgi:hypothetical protein